MSRAALTSTLCAVALAACGDDEESADTDRAGTVTAPAQTATGTQTQTAPPVETSPSQSVPAETERGTGASPEDQPGGAGDEEPARSEAALTGRGGHITPRVVLVPPFLAVRVSLRSADRRAYELAGSGRRLSVGAQIPTASTTFAGLRPGRRIVLRGAGGRVVIEASAEPGP